MIVSILSYAGRQPIWYLPMTAPAVLALALKLLVKYIMACSGRTSAFAEILPVVTSGHPSLYICMPRSPPGHSLSTCDVLWSFLCFS